ncbi:MAG: hypothetical protein GFH27_549281n112 [Chloroflexi bacterium AL-W]|nr:hypothetical protein [Chloroflexi bacterium AL-N1]NOK65998.1 hypothetical protein [Chloroflexi bacterium AL-N10]NOK72879.1 hypothetical protein [Chloroflexi bacterium AL-N5]NOK79776.1 hypothetical protein [Chloroflexi bacterium AL-W]NOK88368.1 hypothetical protein [Chloroflexi bacterium AL-N15]
MQRQMTKATDAILEKRKYYAENDEIHPLKQKQLAAV